MRGRRGCRVAAPPTVYTIKETRLSARTAIVAARVAGGSERSARGALASSTLGTAEMVMAATKGRKSRQ